MSEICSKLIINVTIYFKEEPHGETVKPYAYFSLIVLIPAFSAYAWHHEYEEKFKHRERRPWPRYEFVNQKTGVSYKSYSLFISTINIRWSKKIFS